MDEQVKQNEDEEENEEEKEIEGEEDALPLWWAFLHRQIG